MEYLQYICTCAQIGDCLVEISESRVSKILDSTLEVINKNYKTIYIYVKFNETIIYNKIFARAKLSLSLSLSYM